MTSCIPPPHQSEDHREGKASEAGRGAYPWLLLVLVAYSCTSNDGIGRTGRVLQGPSSHGFPENCVIYIICVKCIICVINVICIICTFDHQAQYCEHCRARTFLNLASSLAAARPSMSNNSSTNSNNACRIARISVMIPPKSMACIESLMSI